MVEAVQTMDGEGESLRGLWRRLRSLPEIRRVATFVLVLGGAILVAALVATLVENTLLDPNVTIEGGAISPDRKWVALTDEVIPGPATGSYDTAVELRHLDGLLMGPTINRTFLLKFDSSKVELRRVRWYTNTLLEITVRADPEDMPKPISQVEDVQIDYRRLDWK